MKKLLLALVVMLVVSGCETLKWEDVDKEDVAYRVGRVTTLGYMMKKDDLTPEQLDMVKKVWTVFDVMAGKINGEDASKFDVIIKEKLKSKIQDKQQYMIACELVDMVWKDLIARVDLSECSNNELVKIVLALHKGIKEAYVELK